MKARRLLLLAVAMTGILALAPVGLRAQGSKPPASTEPQWKDRAEYDLYDAISKDTNPQTKLEKLVEWRGKDPPDDLPATPHKTFFATHPPPPKRPEAPQTHQQRAPPNPPSIYSSR